MWATLASRKCWRFPLLQFRKKLSILEVSNFTTASSWSFKIARVVMHMRQNWITTRKLQERKSPVPSRCQNYLQKSVVCLVILATSRYRRLTVLQFSRSNSVLPHMHNQSSDFKRSRVYCCKIRDLQNWQFLCGIVKVKIFSTFALPNLPTC